MHAAQVGLAGSLHAVSAQPLAIKWVQGAGASQQGTGWSWAKAIGVETTAAESSAQPSKAGVVKTESDGATQRVPLETATDKPGETEKPIASVAATFAEPAATAESDLSTLGKQAVVTVPRLATAPSKKSIEVADDKARPASETVKHKTIKTEDENAKAITPAQALSNPVAPIAADVVPAQVLVGPVMPKATAADKGKEKTAAVTAKPTNAATPKGADGPAKIEAVDLKTTKSVTAMADGSQKPVPELDAKLKTVEAIVVTSAPAVHGTSNDAVAAIAMTGEAAGGAHKLVTTATAQISAEPRSAAATAGPMEMNSAQMISSGSGTLEIGVLDGTHGWLSIRTEMNSNGAVNALLTSGATAHDGLRGSIPAMAGYLASEQLNVDRIAVGSSPASSSAGNDLSQSGEGSSRQQDRADSQTAGAGWTDAGDKFQEATDVDTGISAALFGGAGVVYHGDGIGSWLSVTA